jgi:RHH-type proline utilization regulon transcriptional repressor/proline dehydrogenase/delta 1-pyrroline-5-carboxylate dehydrogenase
MLSSLFRRKPVALSVTTATPVSASTTTEVEARTLALGRDLLALARANQAGLLSKQFWQDKLMNWSMKDEQFKVQLFRFVDTFPALRDPDAVHEHLVDYLSQPGVTLPPGLSLGLAAGGLAKGLLTRTVTSQIQTMAGNFIAGTDAASALPVLRARWERSIAFSVDLLGEACVSQAEVDEYRRRYLDLVESLPGAVAAFARNPLLQTDHLGAIPRTNVSIKISALSVKTDPIDFEGSLEKTTESILPILRAAEKHGVLVNFDMEHRALKDLTLELFMRCCEKVNFHAGIAVQAYLRSGDDDAARLVRWSKRTGRQVTVRLVKGAYWDFETILADQNGWPCPVWASKRDTDACFERMSAAFIGAIPRSAGEGGTKLALGSHNLRSIAAALARLESAGLPTSALELQMLHGMADALKAVAVDRGLRLREYVPVGQMIPGMAYLVRRLLENTSNESWLRAGFLDDAAESTLLASPHREPPDTVVPDTQPADRARRHQLSAAAPGFSELPFFTEPFRDFADAAQRDAFAAAVANTTPLRVEISATPADADKAVATAAAAFPRFAATEVERRAKVLLRAADLLRARRDALAAALLKENGKNWRNADADVAEAIDFCTYYAHSALELFAPVRLGRFTGENNQQLHQPRGVCVVIPPWNFPLAIAAGMTVAALVTGNPVVLKPAEQTPGIARQLAEILWEALRAEGLPTELLQFVAGRGETVGAQLVRDPRVAIIAFTGSRDVGLDILRAAAPPSPFEPGFTPPSDLKHVVCEMGGKNAIIVDTSADLDEAVLGVRESAFGFSGQKCSACSRVIVVSPADRQGMGEDLHDTFLRRLVESSRTLVVGDPAHPGTDLGPVIDDDAAAKIRSYIDLGRTEGRLELAIDRPDLGPRYIGPHIFSGIQPHHRLFTEEIFGPVLSVVRATDFTHALELANLSPYRLTGGVYSRKPTHLDLARARFNVGNLYLNRPITGALVGRQPFGGHALSGTGSKAGGADYLKHFTHTRIVTENTMRRGFAPEV